MPCPASGERGDMRCFGGSDDEAGAERERRKRQIQRQRQRQAERQREGGREGGRGTLRERGMEMEMEMEGERERDGRAKSSARLLVSGWLCWAWGTEVPIPPPK